MGQEDIVVSFFETEEVTGSKPVSPIPPKTPEPLDLEALKAYKSRGFQLQDIPAERTGHVTFGHF
jgi:hypothetical protein